eukprot:7089396-Prymnesium_polylepis.1
MGQVCACREQEAAATGFGDSAAHATVQRNGKFQVESRNANVCIGHRPLGLARGGSELTPAPLCELTPGTDQCMQRCSGSSSAHADHALSHVAYREWILRKHRKWCRGNCHELRDGALSSFRVAHIPHSDTALVLAQLVDTLLA